MKIEELLTTYWSQTTLMLIGIGYFIKRIFDDKSKKIEINHTLYQQHRISVVNKFFENYSKVKLMWDQIAIYDVLSRKYSAKEIDNLIFPTLNDLEKNLMELMIYFKESEYKKFKLLVDNLYSINRKLSNLYFDPGTELTDVEKGNEFQLIKFQVNSENEEILKELNLEIQKIYSN